MRILTFAFSKYRTPLFSLTILLFLSILYSLPAYGQVDYYYGVNGKGLRFGVGGGVSILNGNYDTNPASAVFTTNLDYDFNPYLSIGIEGQLGQLYGKDPAGKQYYSSSLNDYVAGNINIRASIGEFYDFETMNKFTDAIKRLYIGAGVGIIQTDITYGAHTSTANQEQAAELRNHFTVIPINIGTNINLRRILGEDKLELNPNYQYNYANTTFLDGVGASKGSNTKSSGYSLISLSLKYKF